MNELNEQVVAGRGLGQHFQNYFELLLASERGKLRVAINDGGGEVESGVQSLLNLIEQRMAYLRGAVRMGELLGLICSEEAKSKHMLLTHVHESLSACCKRKFDDNFGNKPKLGKPRSFRSLLPIVK